MIYTIYLQAVRLILIFVISKLIYGLVDSVNDDIPMKTYIVENIVKNRNIKWIVKILRKFT